MQTWTFPARFTVEPAGEVVVAFSDLPEALTGAASLPEARALAADALEEAVLAYLAAGRVVPAPRAPRDGEEAVPLPPLTAARAALAAAMREQSVTERVLAGRLSQTEGAVRRLVDGAAGVTMDKVLAALAALGRHANLAVVAA